MELLLFIQGWIFLALASAQFQSSAMNTLDKAAIFPTSSWDRFVFSIVDNLQRPIIILWWGGTILAFLVLLHRNLGEILIPAFLFSMLVFLLQSMVSCLLLFARRMAASVSVLLWSLAAFLIILAVSSLILQTQDLISLILPVHWVAIALTALRENSLLPAFQSGGFILASIVVTMAFGRKYC
jgi:hypothetical protein